MPQDRQAAIYEQLDRMRRQQGIEPLKQMFWAELSYERANTPLSTRAWPAGEQGHLADDPLLFACGGRDQDFHVVYLRLAGELARTPERALVNRLLNDHPHALLSSPTRRGETGASSTSRTTCTTRASARSSGASPSVPTSSSAPRASGWPCSTWRDSRARPLDRSRPGTTRHLTLSR